MEDEYKIYMAKPGDSIDNEFNEKWIKLDNDNPAYKMAEDSVTLTDKSCRIEMLSVISVHDDEGNDYYIAFYAGGLNGGHKENKWGWYFGEMAKMVNSFNHAWVIDMTNDCCDDVWYLTVGFMM